MAEKHRSDIEEHVPPFPELCEYLSEGSPQSLVAVDGITHVVSYTNSSFAKLAGRQINQLLGLQFAEAVPEGAENGALALLDRVLRTGFAENLAEQEHRQSQPNPVYWSYATWPILGSQGQPVGVMVQVTDATEIARFRMQSIAMNESLLVAAAKQHELTEIADSLSEQWEAAAHTRDHFLAALSHELRNPLAALNSGLQLLNLTPHDEGGAADSKKMMERQLAHLVRLVDDLLDRSRITTGKLKLHRQRVALAPIVRDAVEASRTFLDSAGHDVAVHLPSDPILIDADPVRLTQVLLNLLHNAAKFSEPGQGIQLTARLDGGEVEVSVRDHGVGIATTELRHIFEAYVQVDSSWRRTPGGMGIGLSLVKQLVELHGGRVEARSLGLGRGSEFLVRLPVAQGAIADAPIAAEQGGLRHWRILVVDDNRDAARSLAMLLHMMGHETRTAFDCETALAIASEYHPDVVLMDLGMPQVDGFVAAKRLRSEPWGANIMLVALTGWGAAEDRRRTREAGFDLHLVKPVDMAALTSLLAEMKGGDSASPVNGNADEDGATAS